uniref:Metalloendopeptidase n=1 Tax=Anisakis simplex TaxID=6269 RepID=A0A0M3JCS5_ANISI
LDEIDHLGTPYDYKSVMHYDSTAFSKNGQPTIEPKASGTKLGQREGFSQNDIKKINILYECDGNTGGGGGDGSAPGPAPGPAPQDCEDEVINCGEFKEYCDDEYSEDLRECLLENLCMTAYKLGPLGVEDS